MTPDQICRLPNVSESVPAKIVPVMAAEKGAEAENAVAPRQFLFRQQFRQHSVFRRAENRAVRAHQKNARQHQRNIAEPQAERRHGHDAQFGAFDGDGDAAFAVAVGEKSPGH